MRAWAPNKNLSIGHYRFDTLEVKVDRVYDTFVLHAHESK